MLTPDVAAGELIQSAWGNEIRDRTRQVFTDVAARDSEWPDVPDGASCVTLDTGTTWYRLGGAWTSLATRYATRSWTIGLVTAQAYYDGSPGALAGWWTVGAPPDGTMTFLRAAVVAWQLAANRTTGGGDDWQLTVFPPAGGPIQRAPAVVSGASATLSGIEPVPAGGTLRLTVRAGTTGATVNVRSTVVVLT